MSRYALIICIMYYNIKNLPVLTCTENDLIMIYKLCKKLGIEDNNITIITDLKTIPYILYLTNLKNKCYIDDIFFCTELSNFFENTLIKSDIESDVLLYISSHGSELNINNQIKQSIILRSSDGCEIRYLLSEDIFNIIFGNIYISEDGIFNIPIYKKIEKVIRINNEIEKKNKILYIPKIDNLTIQLDNSDNRYLKDRGMPINNKLLCIIDSCYSGNMTHFPYIYDNMEKKMKTCDYYNEEIHQDLPYCVCISSCESNKTSNFNSSGSSLTKILYNKLIKYNGVLDITLVYYLIYSCNDNLFLSFLKGKCSKPIITSTSYNSSKNIPFFNYHD
jgi:hypothetical protein